MTRTRRSRDAPGVRFECVSVPGLEGFPPVRRDAAPRRVPTTRQAGERRRRIIDVHIIASLNRVTILSTTPGNMLFGPLSSLAAHHHRFIAFFFQTFRRDALACPRDRRPTAFANILKTRTRHRGLCRRRSIP